MLCRRPRSVYCVFGNRVTTTRVLSSVAVSLRSHVESLGVFSPWLRSCPFWAAPSLLSGMARHLS